MVRLLDTLSDCVLIIDREGTIKFCNNKTLKELGYNEEELKDRNIKNILSNSDDNKLDKVIKNIKKDDRLNINLEVIDKNKEKRLLDGDIVVSEFDDKEHIFIVCREYHNKYYNIKDLENILDSIPYAIYIKGTNNEVIYANKNFLNGTSNDKYNILGENIEEIVSGYKNNHILNLEKDIIKSKKPRLIEASVEKDDNKLYLEMFMVPIFKKNEELKYIISTVQDITLKKVIENNIDKRNVEALDINRYMHNDMDMKELLDNLLKDIAKYIRADSLTLYLYDEDSEVLKLKSLYGEVENLNNIPDSITFGKKELEETLNHKEIGRILKSLGPNDIRKNAYESLNKNLNLVGSYNLMNANEFIGILNISYLEGNEPKYYQNDFMNNLCSRIALIVKSYNLSVKAKIERERRLDIEYELERLLDISVDMFAIINENGYFRNLSPQWSKTLGWSEEELKSKPATEFIHPTHRKEVLNMSRKKDSNISRTENRVLSKDGEYLWFKWNYKYIQEKKYFIVTTRNITKEKEEEKSRKLLEKAIEVESIKNEFFANISHEFKTPINIILGTMQLLERKCKIQDSEYISVYNLINHTKSIKQNSYRLLRLVNNLIDMTRIDTGFYELNLGNYNIINIIEEITLSVAEYIEGKGINLTFDTDSEETIIACDPDIIERIVLNILSNAIKYTDKDGEIKVDIKVINTKVVVSIKDNGVGISKEKLPFIFDRFRQGDNVLTRRCEGSGIGLSLVKSLVTMHEGDVYANSKIGYGSEFVFELPIRLIKENNNLIKNNFTQPKIEKCNIEFSDIYSI